MPRAVPPQDVVTTWQQLIGNASVARALSGVRAQGGTPVQRHIEQVEQAADRTLGDLTPEDATRLLAEFAAAPATLARFGPRRCLLHLLREVEAGGRTVTRAELDRRSARYAPLVVVRPDGYWARALTGEAVQRAFPVERMASPPYEIGAFHYSNSGVIYRVDDSLAAAGPPVAELGLEHDVVNAALDGAEDAVVAMARGLRELITHPIRTIAGLANLPGAVAQLIADSPEYWARFQAMPLPDQVRKVSEIVSTLVLMYGTASGSATTIAGAAADLGDVTVNVLRLQADGALAVARVSVPVGAVATAMSGGPGAIYVLSMANNAAGGSGGSGGSGGGSGGPVNPPEFLQAVRDMDRAQVSKALSATERGALEWNAEQIATKTAQPTATGQYPWQSLWNQLQRPRWRFLNQAPEAARTLRDMINRLPAAGRDPALPDRAALLAQLERWLSSP
ncbi:MAG: hypothetical protein HOY78_33215 [Saccharothrix sp.]|nr:hypothetical protein [Saccharothrix sp.]